VTSPAIKHWPYPRWVAHRGAGKLAPENTLAAFKLGASHGYRMFECDAKLSADGVPFLMHDATLTRTTNKREMFGPAPSDLGGDHPWSELAKLDAGGWHSRAYAGEPLPTLENISRFCMANGHLLNIEIKPTPGAERATGDVVARHADRLWNNAPVPPLLTSFQVESLEGARATSPRLPRGLLLDTLREGWLETALALDCVAVVCNHALWDRGTVTQAQSAGLRCLSYTVNDEWAAQRLIALGTDGIITDRVDLFAPG
jgi:glycerophosphoryl diester phosphodiesterase